MPGSGACRTATPASRFYGAPGVGIGVSRHEAGDRIASRLQISRSYGSGPGSQPSKATAACLTSLVNGVSSASPDFSQTTAIDHCLVRAVVFGAAAATHVA